MFSVFYDRLDLISVYFVRSTFFSLSDSRSHAKSKLGEGLEGRTKVITDDKFKALNKALKVDKKKPKGN